jgi:hypothetical protein
MGSGPGLKYYRLGQFEVDLAWKAGPEQETDLVFEADAYRDVPISIFASVFILV